MLDRELASFICMGLLVLAMLMIKFARSKPLGGLRVILTAFAYLMLIPATILMIYVIF